VTSLRQQHVAGLLIVPARDDRHRPPDLDPRLPVVYVDRPPRSGEGDAVVLDNRGGARQGVEHLIRLGHRRIGLVGDRLPYFTIDERIAGYREALAGAGIPLDPSLLLLNARDVARAGAATRHLLSLDQPPTALFALNNRTCVGVLQVVTGERRAVSVLGFDGLELAGLLSIQLTLITHDPGELGRSAARLLFARLAGDRGPRRRTVLPTTLVSYDGSGRSETAACP
ncbi:MAG: substrate-binding domain-containing protein, partial [Chloroflexota bacterium]